MTFDGSLTTSGSQSYSSAVTLATDETLTSTAGSITFNSTIDGAHALSVNAASGTITFGDFVGGGTPLSSLTAEGSNVVVDSNITAANSIFLKGAVTFAGGTIETLPTGTVSLQADAPAFNAPETIFTGTFEYAPLTSATAVTLGMGGVLPNADLSINATTLRVGAVTDPVTSTLDTTAGSITIAAGGFVSPSTDLDLETTGAITGGSLFANTLTGNADSLSLTGSNGILTLGSFTAANNFTLNDNTQLTITGPLTSTNGNIVLTGGSPVILAGNVSASGSGTQMVAFQTGDITQTGGSLIADELTGLALSASFTQAGNKVGTLEAFETINGFALTNSIALTVAGNNVSALGIPAGIQTTNGNITLTTTGTSQDITLATTLTANNAGQDISLNASGSIDQTSGHILATELSGSAGGTVTLGGPTTNQDLIASLGTFTAGSDFALIDQSALTVSGAVSSTTGNIGIQTVGTNTGITIASGGSLSAAGGGTQVVLLQSSGAITETGGGTIAADELMTFSQGDTSLLSAGNAVSTLEGVLSTGNFYLADASALTVAGNDVAFGSFNLPVTNIEAGNGGTGNVYLESTNASGISFGTANTTSISASTNGLISIQADTVNFGSHGTGFSGGTLEYAPATQGATATLGASGGLVDNIVGFGVKSHPRRRGDGPGNGRDDDCGRDQRGRCFQRERTPGRTRHHGHRHRNGKRPVVRCVDAFGRCRIGRPHDQRQWHRRYRRVHDDRRVPAAGRRGAHAERRARRGLGHAHGYKRHHLRHRRLGYDDGRRSDLCGGRDARVRYDAGSYGRRHGRLPGAAGRRVPSHDRRQRRVRQSRRHSHAACEPHRQRHDPARWAGDHYDRQPDLFRRRYARRFPGGTRKHE